MNCYDVEVTVVTTGNIVTKAIIRTWGMNPRQAQDSAIMVDEVLGTKIPEHLTASVSTIIVGTPGFMTVYRSPIR